MRTKFFSGKNKTGRWVSLFLIIFTVGAVSFFGYRYLSSLSSEELYSFFLNPFSKATPEATITPPSSLTPTPTRIPTPTPTPRPIASGKQEYDVSMSSTVWPKMTRVVVNPLDPALLGKQTISVKLNDTKPITSVTATVKMNDDSKTLPLALVEGTDLDGRWEGSWRVNYSYSNYYHIVLDGVSETGKSSIDITIR